ncbi:MAG TPA: universal stress protein [Desulfobacteraceae bacterium]|nr:universal stress protein [Desulfobacteraceae bacterium]
MLPWKKILIAFDGSSSANKAFDLALRMCPEDGPEIIVASVVQPPEQAEIVEMEAVIDSARDQFEKLFAELRDKAAAVSGPIATEILIGHPADQIVHYAAENQCDVILVGQRGKSRIEQWLLGSVSKRIATYAHCTVIIVK